MESQQLFYPHVSVDCVLIGFNGEDIKILLVEKNENKNNFSSNDLKLPGRLIYENEDVDQAAYSVLNELTGIKQLYLRQFKTFGSPDRTAKSGDRQWLENAVKLKIGRIVTVAYMALVKIDKNINYISPKYKARWVSLGTLPSLAFDHNQIITEAMQEVQRSVKLDIAILFELLPLKFTAYQLRRLNELIDNKSLDVRNFHKKIKSMPCLIALDEYETNVAHRAARFYRFDRKKHNKL